MTKKPLILVTNDDGITAPGIRALIDVMNEIGDVVVVAPDSPQSGMGHAITINSTLHCSKIDVDHGPQTEYSCSGTPADCVKLAVNELLGRKPDLCVSGINHGSNSSINVIYSGTMSAALEAGIEGIPAIGFSLLDYRWGADFEVVHHTQLINQLIREGRLLLKGGGKFDGKKITFHDPCYLGRANDVYEAPREVLEKLDAELVEMKRSKAKGLCCGAGGAQMFKDAEKGNKEINIERTQDAIEVNADYIATGCPFCNTMMTDGIKHFEKEEKVKVLDIAELISNAADL